MLNLNKHTVLNSILLTIVFVSFSIFSTAKGTEELAKKLFEEQKYSEALPYFEELNVLYPNDKPFQYFYGVCLTKTNNYELKTRKLLLLASQGKVPTNVFFYIGENYHALNDFETAKTYYQRFAEYARKKERKALTFDEIVTQCEAGINPFVAKHSIPTEKNKQITKSEIKQHINTINPVHSVSSTTINTLAIKTQPIDTTTESVIQQNGTLVPNLKPITFAADSSLPVKPIETKELYVKQIIVPVELMDTTFNFTLTSTIYYQIIGQFKTDTGKTAFIKGWNNSQELTQLLLKLEQLRNEYRNATDDKKRNISQAALKMEMKTLRLKTDIDKSYLEARVAEMNYWNNASNRELQKLISTNDSISNLTCQEKQKETINEVINSTDTIPIATDSIKSHVISNPIEDSKNQLIYKVQIGAYSKGLPEYIDRLYKKLTVLRKIDHYTDDRGIVVYTIGKLSNFKDALKLQDQIRQEGVKDAFVVAYNNGKRITLKEAKEMTKE